MKKNIYPEVSKAKKIYSNEFRVEFTRSPLKKTIQIIWFEIQNILNYFSLYKFRKISKVNKSILNITSILQPPTYKYRGYNGPWIEDYFYKYFVNQKINNDFVYIPIFWDRFYFQSQNHKYFPDKYEKIYNEMQFVLQELINPEKMYFTILGMYEFPIWNWHKFPKNVLIFSSAGYGDIPIPLLNGNHKYKNYKKDILISFMGELKGANNKNNVRGIMYDTLKEFAYFDKGPHWRSIMQRSIFTLCPRGQGITSFRLYEAMSMGSIPIYIWDDYEWLPYKEILNWNDILISINISDVKKIPEIVNSFTKSEIKVKQENIKKVFDKYFTFKSTSNYIIEKISCIKELEEINILANNRRYD